QVLNKVQLTIHRGEKVAFVGRNGEGKTTMARIIMGELEHEGQCRTGHAVKIGYYAQNQADLLDPERTVFETVDYVAVGEIRSKTRDILGAFLFSGDDVDKKVSVLSGGERARLALACMLLEPRNLLVLDEPTNHLDLRSKQVLKEALLKFTGTLILVSHDRDFLDGLVGKIYEFRHKQIKEYPGDIFEFLKKKKISTLREIEKKESSSRGNDTVKTISDNKQRYEEKKELERQKRKIQSRITRAEEKIEELEKRIQVIEAFLADPVSMADNTGEDPFLEYEQLKAELEVAMSEWEEAHEELLNQDT
ncbi:MAG: ATP-binding cassette domain-containing protein, partial [Bacteroidales bacterium]|nr:ATP-binding cassette domain-containing protein [Bacteroidales bacterium]